MGNRRLSFVHIVAHLHDGFLCNFNWRCPPYLSNRGWCQKMGNFATLICDVLLLAGRDFLDLCMDLAFPAEIPRCGRLLVLQGAAWHY